MAKKIVHDRDAATERYFSEEKERYSKVQESSGMEHGKIGKHRAHAARVYLRGLEILAIALSYLESSRIARFITAKLSMGAVVEVTARMGRDAGHHLSSFLAVLVAEPKLIALIVAGVLLVLEFIGFVVRRARRGSEHRPHRPHGRK